MHGTLKLLFAFALPMLVTGCTDSREAARRQTIENLDTFRELRTWMAADLGTRSGLRISKSAIGDYVRREDGWQHRTGQQDGLSDQQVSEALGLPTDRIHRYLQTAKDLDIQFAIQMPNNTGYASVWETSGGAMSGCVGFLHWGGKPDPEADHLGDDWYFSWACES